jgi:hypothetical protein
MSGINDFVKDELASSRGFVTLGIDSDKDRIQYSYLLATSIKICDPTAQVCLIVEKDKIDIVPEKYLSSFDYITELPFGNTGWKDGFHGSNLWQVRNASPFDETIYLDSDTLFMNVDIDLLWDKLKSYDLAFLDNAKTYRNQDFDKLNTFEIENHYDLPKFFSNFIYFKNDSPLAIEWFKMADPVFQNWREVYKKTFNEKKPDTFDKTLLVNMTCNFLNIDKEISVDIPYYYDLENRGQRIWNKDIPYEWTEMLNHWINIRKQLLIETHAISSGIIHYRCEDFVTKDMISDFTDYLSDKETLRET